MESLRRLTDTINTFVRFFESINCLFWQIQWLEQNINRAQGIDGLARIFLVIIFVLFSVYYTFVCGQNRKCQDGAMYIGIILLLGSVVMYLLWKRCRMQNRNTIIIRNDGEYSQISTDEEKFLPRATPVAVAPLHVINDVEMARFRK
jgi:hypothetical protein